MMTQDGMATESLWSEFLPLVYGSEAKQDQTDRIRVTINGAMDEFPTPDDLFRKPLALVRDVAYERRCSKKVFHADRMDH